MTPYVEIIDEVLGLELLNPLRLVAVEEDNGLCHAFLGHFHVTSSGGLEHAKQELFKRIQQTAITTTMDSPFSDFTIQWWKHNIVPNEPPTFIPEWQALCSVCLGKRIVDDSRYFDSLSKRISRSWCFECDGKGVVFTDKFNEFKKLVQLVSKH
jgi:hypothetical protein